MDNVIELKQRHPFLIDQWVRLGSINLITGVGLGRGIVGVEMAVSVSRKSDFLNSRLRRAAAICITQADSDNLKNRVVAATEELPELDGSQTIGVVSNEEPHPRLCDWLHMVNELASEICQPPHGLGLILLEINSAADLYDPEAVALLVHLRDSTGACVMVSCASQGGAEAMEGLSPHHEGGAALLAAVEAQIAVVEDGDQWTITKLDGSGIAIPFSVGRVTLSTVVPVVRCK